VSASTVNTRGFSQMCKHLARMADVPPQDAVTHEVGRVIETTMNSTKSASAAKIKNYGSRFYAVGQDAYSPKRVRRYGNPTKNGYLYYYMENRYPNDLWRALVGRRAASRKKKLAARGLSKQSWLRLAQQLGTPIKARDYVANAVPTTGQQYQNTSVRIQKGKGTLLIVTANSQPTVVKLGGAREFQAAIDGREKFFVRNIGLRVFNDAAKIAKQYPGMKAKAA
jgi:hypothetical protein